MPGRPHPIWAGYAVAVISILVAAIARWLLSSPFGVYPYAPIFIAIIFSAWYGGFGPALLVAALGLALGILTSATDTRPGNGHAVFGLVLYSITSLGIALVGGAMARAREKIAHQMDELRRQHCELMVADQRKDQFLAVLAHELRNPLAPIASALDILKQDDVNPNVAAKAIEVADRQVHHMTRLVDDLLDVSRIMRGKIELRKERVELASIIDRAVETVQPLIDRERHQLTIDLPTESVWIKADLVRLAQAVANLLSNAAKYTEAGGNIRLSAAVEEGHYLVLSVRDSGIGIDPATLPQLFEMFMQAAPGSSRSRGGLGIGLTLVKNLVELHGGAIAAHSDGLGKGSEFMIRLPYEETTAEAPSAPPKPAVKASRRRILVVDDNVDAAQSLAMLLRLRGHDVQAAFGGAEALESASADEPELVFLDIGMPVMDGYEVARQLRTRFGSELTIVALTGWGTEQDRQRSRAAGFDQHLTKPVDLAALEGVLANFSDPADQPRPMLQATNT